MRAVHAPHLRRSVVLGGRRRPPPPKPGEKRLKLHDYLSPSLPPALAAVDYSPSAVAALRQMYMNDQLGCCTITSKAHLQGVWTGNATVPPTPTLWTSDQIVKAYSDCGGYVVGQPQTDQGCDDVTVLKYFSKGGTGFPDGSFAEGWVELDGANADEVRQTINLFEGADLCAELPEGWVAPFPSADGFVWDVTSAGSNPQNGHCFPAVGYDAAGPTICTWALLGKITWAALAAYCVESAGGALYVLLSAEQIANGKTAAPNGIDWACLQADLAALQAQAPASA